MDGQYLPDDEIDIDSLASSEPPEYVPQMFSEGGEVQEEDIEYYAKGGEASFDQSVETMNKYLLADEEDAMPMAYATTPYGVSERAAPEMSAKTAKLMLKQLSTKGGGGGKSKRPKEMSLEAGDLSPAIPELGAPQTEQEKLIQIATARAQYDALERAYQLKAQAAQKAGRGLMRPTFNALAFDKPTLEKPGPLMARTFQLGGLVSKALKSGAKKGASSVDNVVPSSARSLFPEQESSLFPSIIKEEGGNWMGGSTSPEAFVKPLYKAENLDNPAKAKSLNKWIDKKLTPYIKNKMATPSDPVRKLADEEGILPFPDARDNNAVTSEVTAKINRQVAGLPIEQQAPIATTPRGQAWENKADAAIRVSPYQDMVPFGYSNDPNEVLREFGGEFAVQNPTAKVNAMNTGRGPRDLGFDHIVDVLQENLTTGRLSPDSLRGLSMEDAVRLTYQYDLDMAKKMAEARIQALEGVPVYKQYPEQGFRWMQLDKPGYFAAESDAMGHSVRGYEPPVGHPDWTPQSGNKGTPGYGYGGWEAIKSGDVKVYSLADDMGKRYTTIEQVPGTHPLGTTARGNDFPDQIRYGGVASSSGETIPEETLQEIYALGKKMYFENPNAFAENRVLSGVATPSAMDSFQKAADMVLGKRPPSIRQIKGPVNGYIGDDAQPFVQDFLNSGNWSDVGDLYLTGLKDLRDNPDLENFVRTSQLDNRRFLTKEEYDRYEGELLRPELKRQLGGFDPLPPPTNPAGMARGGMVQHFDGGGMAMSSPEESDSYSAEPAQFVKDMKSDYARLKASPTAREQLAKIAALQLSQSGPDLAALGVEYLIDPLKSVTLDKVFTRPKFRSVLDKPANPRSPRIADQPQREPMLGSLSDALRTKDGNFIGSSEDVIKRAQDAKLMGPSRFSPLTEAGASLGLGLGSFAAKPTAKFLGKEAARQVERGVFNEGPLRAITPQPMYISRPPGGYFPTSRGMGEKTVEEINNTKLSDLPENFVSWLNADDKQKASFLGLGPKRESLGDKYNRWKAETGSKDYTFGILSGVDKSLQPVLKKITEMEPGEKRDALFQMFNQKAKDFYSKQAGSIQDPLRADILGGNIKFDMDSKMGDVFPKTLVKSAAQGDLQALRLLEKSYDDMIGVKAVVPYRRVPSRPDDIPPQNTLKRQIIESVRDNLDSIPDSQLLAYAGKKPLPGPDGVAKAAKEVRLKLKENPNLFSTVLEPNIERTVFARESRYSDLDLAKYPNLYGTTATEAMINPQGPAFTKDQFEAMDALPQGYFLPELETAINKSQPMLDAQEYGNLRLLGLTTDKLLQEANRLSAKDLNSMGFTDFLKKAYKSSEEVAQMEKDLKRVKPLLQQGKPPPANVMLFGVKDFLPTVNDMRWVKVTNPDGVKSIAAGMNNSVGSYATSETYGALGRGRRALDKGEIEVYALYDKNHVPHVTVEYGTGKSSVPEKQRSQILQLTGNGPLTVNESSSNYAEQIAALVNALPIKDVTALPASTQKILKNNFFEFKDNRVVRNEEEFTKNQEVRKELGLAKGGSVDKNMAFIKKHT
jgi:hypothetical protein